MLGFCGCDQRAEHGQQRGSEDEAERGSARVVDRPDDEPGAVHSAEEDNERGTTRDNCPVPLSSFFLQKIFAVSAGGLAGGEGGAVVADGASFFEEVVVAAGIRGDAARVDMEDFGGEFTDEMDVVADEDERAFVAAEGEDEGFDRMDIEVGGGLIHEEEVGGIDEELDEIEAGFFSTGKDLGFFVDFVFAKEEGAENASGFIFGECAIGVHDFLEDGFVGVEGGGAVLAEVADFGIEAEFPFTALGFEDTAEEFEEGAFAAPVGADEDGAFAAFDIEIEATVDGIFGVTEVNFFEADDALATARGLRDLEAERFAWGDGFFDEIHAFDLLEFAHGLAGLGGDLAEAIVEFAEVGDFLLLIFVGGVLLFVAFLFEAEEVSVIARIRDELSFIDFVDAADDFVHESAIMGDEKNGTGIGLEILLEPEERDEIEVIGGFVEHEEIGLHDEESGEVGPHHPATGEFPGGLIEIGFAEAEAGEHSFGFGFDLGIAEGLVFGVGFEVDGATDIARLFAGVEDGFEALDFACSTGGDIHSGLHAKDFGFLGEVADHRPFVAFDRSVVLFLGVENDIKEGGFSGAIGAD